MALEDVLAMIAGSAISILVEILPPFSSWWQELADQYKRLVMAAAMLLVAAAIYGMACAGWLPVLFPEIAVSCDQGGIFVLIKAFIAALVANQSTYTLFFSGKRQ